MLAVSYKLMRGNTKIGGGRFVYPNCTGYPASSPVYSGSVPTIAEANANLKSRTSGYLYEGFPVGCSICRSDTDSGGFVDFNTAYRGVNLSDLQVGDRLVFENNSYIEISSKTYIPGSGSNYDITQVNLRYYTMDDELAYTVTGIGNQIREDQNVTGHYEYLSFLAFPWLWNKSDSDVRLGSGTVSSDWVYETVGTHDIPRCYYSFAWRGYTSPVSRALGHKFFNGIPDVDPDDPYPDDDSDDDFPDGPDGVPDDDPVPFPDDPSIDVLDSGFITLFAPTKAQVHNLASYMWAGGFDINTFRKIFADPMDCILGFNILPFQVNRGSTASVTVGNISTGVEMYKAGGQWQTIDCGSLNLGKIYDTYLDYAPYTKWSIYLPFIGLQQLSTDDVAHKTLHLKYKIDILSCSCVAYLMCDDTILYQYSGSCGYAIPITSDNFASMISNIVSIAATGASLIASGGVTAPMAVGATASVANNVMGLKPDIKRGGSIGASAGLMGVQKPYVIVEIPNICKPSMQHKYLGYPSFITKTVKDVEGYSEWESIILDGIPCTDAERAEILEIMKGGLYV